MAHNLYLNKIGYHGATPWHKLGTQFADYMTADQAIEAAGLNYTVIKEQLQRPSTGDLMNAYCTINSANNKVLGIVKSRYEIIQPADCRVFFDELCGKAKGVYESAFAMGNGERICYLVKLPIEFEPIMGDKVDNFMLLYNSYTGLEPLSIKLTPIRVICQNTFEMAMRNCTNVIKVNHTKNANERLAEAGRILKGMNDYFTLVGEKCKDLAAYNIDDDFIQAYINSLFGNESETPDNMKDIRFNNINMFKGRFHNGMGVDIPGVQGTAWHIYNAATEFADSILARGKNKDNDKDIDTTKSVLWGPSAKFKQKAFDSVFALMGA